MMATHYWIRADRQAARTAVLGMLPLPPSVLRISAHRRLRGPYTAAGTLLRVIGEEALLLRPDLGRRHHIEILTAAPEFEHLAPPIKATLELTGASGSRTRYQARLHSLRVAHGLVEFIRDGLAVRGADAGPRTLVVDDVHEADPTDLEFLAVLLRRIPADVLTVVIGSATRTLVDPPGPVSASLTPVLARYAREIIPAEIIPADIAGGGHAGAGYAGGGYAGGDGITGDDESLAWAFVASDGISDDPAERAAYDRLPVALRAELHDRRAATLAEQGQRSWWYGAIPYHAEHGSDPAGAGATALRQAQIRAKNHGLYHSAVEYGLRGRDLVDRTLNAELWWNFTGDITTSLASGGRAAETEQMYAEIRAITVDPLIHMYAAYGTAMLYARHYEDGRRDIGKARQWVNLAIAIASQLPDPKERAFHSVFNGNGLALIEMRDGRPDEAMRLLNEGMYRLDQELEPGEQLLHRTGLRYNRAQLLVLMGRFAEALDDLDAVITVDPNFHDHYFNRGMALRRLGRCEEAIANYDLSLTLSPPFPEAYYNRADAKLELGDGDGARADLDRVLDLDPAHVDALVNRAGLLCDLDDGDAAWADVTAGLKLAPGNAHLLSIRGRLRLDRGDTQAAYADLTAALETDAGLAEAWAIRGVLTHATGDLDAAIEDLTRAVAAGDTPQIRFNRAVMLADAGRFAEAAADYAAVLDQADDPDARSGLAACRAAMAAPASV